MQQTRRRTRRPAAPVDSAPAVPTRPQTPEEKALQAHADALLAPLAAAAAAGNAADYSAALNKIAAKNCQFFSVSGQSVSLPKFLEVKRQAFATQGSGLTETSKTQSLYITGPTAIQTGVLTDDQDVADAAGTYGKKGATHHWQRLTFFRIHWADSPTRRTSAKRASALNPDDWKAQEIAFTDIQIFLDGSPYIPPSARKSSTRRNTTRTTTPKTKTGAPLGPDLDAALSLRHHRGPDRHVLTGVNRSLLWRAAGDAPRRGLADFSETGQGEKMDVQPPGRITTSRSRTPAPQYSMPGWAKTPTPIAAKSRAVRPGSHSPPAHADRGAPGPGL